MSQRIDAAFIIEREQPQQCDFCGAIAELRPYGPNGEAICFPCGMKNETAAKEQFRKRLGTAKKPKRRKRQPSQKHMDDVSREMELEYERQFPPESGSVSSGGKP